MLPRHSVMATSQSGAIRKSFKDPHKLFDRGGGLKMTYEVLDTEAGDVLAVYSSLDAAQSAVREYVGQNPDLAGDMAIATVNGTGLPEKVVPVQDFLTE